MKHLLQSAGILLLALLVVGGTPTPGATASLDVAVGRPFPDLEFPSLLHPTDYAKLGLERTAGPLRLTQIPSDYLVIEFFNKSCRPCQKQVREMEAYYQNLIAGEGPPEIRILAVAVGNKPKYLPKYRTKRGITYPLAADPKFDQWRRLGDPGRTPFTVFLRRVDDGWELESYHFGVHDRERLTAHGATMLIGRKTPVDGIDAPPKLERHYEMALSPGELETLVGRLFERVTGRSLPVETLDLGKDGVFYRTRTPLSGRRLYARAATRAPVCEVCHAVHFLYAFDEDGVVLGFEPIHVTKYGNKVWDETDLEHFTRRLGGRQMEELDFDPEVDTVTSATMTSALIYDEVRRTRPLLDRLRGM